MEMRDFYPWMVLYLQRLFPRGGSFHNPPSSQRIASSSDPFICQEAGGSCYKQDSGTLGSPGFPGVTIADQALLWVVILMGVLSPQEAADPSLEGWRWELDLPCPGGLRLSICPFCMPGSRCPVCFGINCRCACRDWHGFSISCAHLWGDWRLNFRMTGSAQRRWWWLLSGKWPIAETGWGGQQIRDCRFLPWGAETVLWQT